MKINKSLRRAVQARWLVRIIVLILAITLVILIACNSANVSATLILLNSIGAVAVALLSILLVYRNAHKRVGAIPAPWRPAMVTSDEFEKLKTHLTDLRVVFMAVAYSGSALVVALTFVGYTTITDVLSESRITAARELVIALQDSLAKTEQKMEGLREQLLDDHAKFDSLISAVLKREISDTVVTFHEIKQGESVSIFSRVANLDRVVLAKPIIISSDSTVYGQGKIYFADPKPVIQTTSIPQAERRFQSLTRRPHR